MASSHLPTRANHQHLTNATEPVKKRGEQFEPGYTKAASRDLHTEAACFAQRLVRSHAIFLRGHCHCSCKESSRPSRTVSKLKFPLKKFTRYQDQKLEAYVGHPSLECASFNLTKVSSPLCSSSSAATTRASPLPSAAQILPWSSTGLR